MSVILLSEALRILQSGASCSLTYITADRRRGTGGQLVHLPHCVIYSSQQLPKKTQAKITETQSVGVRTTRNPNHHANKTRNVYIPTTREIKTIHIKLITTFNGKKVLL